MLWKSSDTGDTSTSVAMINLILNLNFFDCFFKSNKTVNMMKNLKNLLPVLAILLGLGLVITQSAFKNNTKPSKTDVMFQYQDSDNGRIYDSTAWEEVTSPTAGCPEGVKLPCVVKFDTGDYADIDAYLTAHPTLQSILDDTDHLQSKKDGVINP